ncbi:BNR-4 repeat-containing protein [Pontiellaceae bacterium B12227]|nr:BNR-4 repeat-containing protein [Pontiellaceae bacterium B12227]
MKKIITMLTLLAVTSVEVLAHGRILLDGGSSVSGSITNANGGRDIAGTFALTDSETSSAVSLEIGETFNMQFTIQALAESPTTVGTKIGYGGTGWALNDSLKLGFGDGVQALALQFDLKDFNPKVEFGGDDDAISANNFKLDGNLDKSGELTSAGLTNADKLKFAGDTATFNLTVDHTAANTFDMTLIWGAFTTNYVYTSTADMTSVSDFYVRINDLDVNLGYEVSVIPALYPLYADADQLYSNTNTYDLTQETYTFSELWSTPVQKDINFLPEFYNSPIATRGNDTFVLFVDPDHRMKIAHLTNGVFKGETFIDNTLYQPDDFYANHDADPDNDVSSPDYHRFKFEDSHHSIALGIDEHGYLHMVGDMHNYPRYAGSMDHLPLRYFDKNIMYWRSDNPLDISSFSFKGDQAGECPTGSGFTYLFFFNDLYGKLHITSRAQQTWNNGTRCATYSSYNADAGLWSTLGGAPEPSDPASIPCTFYDDGYEHNEDGSSAGKYSKLRPHGMFDRKNNMHLLSPLLRDPTLNPVGLGNGFHFSDCLVYAQSKDAGATYTSVGGREFTLPATVNLTTNRAEVVYGEVGDYLSPNGQLAVDYMNRPYTSTQKKDLDTGITDNVLLGWDGSSWVNYGDITSAGGDFRLVNDPAGVMSYISDGANVLYRFWNPTNLREVTTPWAIRVIDYEYQKKTGHLMGLARIGNDMAVVKVEINNRPGMVLIDPPAATITNHPPEITAQATLNGQILSVSALDADSDPLTFTWSAFYGPGDITLSQNGTTASSNTTLSVSEEGTYEIKVAVSDGHHTRFSTVTAYLTPNVTDAPQIVTPAIASPDTLTLGGTTILTVSATNAATGGNATYTWLKSSGPGSVSFSVNGTTASSTTEASFDATGTYELQVTVSNSAGTASSSCTVDVNGLPPVPANGYLAIDFSSQAFESFVNDNEFFDRTGTVEVVESGAGVRFTGDLWKAFPIDYQMTPDTVIEFDFSCPNEGELHAIAMTDTPSWDFSGGRYDLIKLHGTDNGLYIMDRDGEYSGGTNRYSIEIGQLLALNTEQKNYLDFVNADNSGEIIPDAQSTFANVIIYEPNGDKDGDGQSNLAEIRLGTDPEDPASMFGINEGTVLPDLGKVRISWPSQAGVRYRIQQSPDLIVWSVARDWTFAQTPPDDQFETELTPSNAFFKVEAEIQ